MQKLASLSQYKQLKQAAKERCGRLASNCLLTATGIEELAAQGSLYYGEYDSGLVLFADEGPYYRALYFLTESGDMPDLRQDKLVSIEELDDGGRRSAYLQGFFAKLEGAGWHRIARNVYVERVLDPSDTGIAEEYASRVQALNDQGLSIGMCQKGQEAGVIGLWRDYLHLTDIPAEHVAFMDDDTQRVVCVSDGDVLCAVNWWQMKGGRCEIRHTVTDPAYYKRGIAYTLQLAALKDAQDAGCRTVFTYIDEVNYRSLALFKKAGIVPNGRTTVQYGLEGEL